MKNPYASRIIEHYQHPRYHETLSMPDFVTTEVNPACGDSINVMGVIRDGTLEALSIQGTGCVLSQAAGSLLAEAVIHQPVAYICALTAADLTCLVGDYGPGRMRCVILALDALKKGLCKHA